MHLFKTRLEFAWRSPFSYLIKELVRLLKFIYASVNVWYYCSCFKLINSVVFLKNIFLLSMALNVLLAACPALSVSSSIIYLTWFPVAPMARKINILSSDFLKLTQSHVTTVDIKHVKICSASLYRSTCTK